MQRLQFVAACPEGSLTVAEVCRRFNISRKTGYYKWLARFSPDDVTSLSDRSRARHHQRATPEPMPMVKLLPETKQQHPLWGPEKIRQRLLNLNVTGVPAASTIGELFRGHGLVKKRKPPTFKPRSGMSCTLPCGQTMSGAPISGGSSPIPAAAGAIPSR
nr:leucine zipper domain-containing protein [Kosakonia sp. S42]